MRRNIIGPRPAGQNSISYMHVLSACPINVVVHKVMLRNFSPPLPCRVIRSVFHLWMLPRDPAALQCLPTVPTTKQRSGDLPFLGCHAILKFSIVYMYLNLLYGLAALAMEPVQIGKNYLVVHRFPQVHEQPFGVVLQLG